MWPSGPALREMGRPEQRTEKIRFPFFEDHSGYCDETRFWGRRAAAGDHLEADQSAGIRWPRLG